MWLLIGHALVVIGNVINVIYDLWSSNFFSQSQGPPVSHCPGNTWTLFMHTESTSHFSLFYVFLSVRSEPGKLCCFECKIFTVNKALKIRIKTILQFIIPQMPCHHYPLAHHTVLEPTVWNECDIVEQNLKVSSNLQICSTTQGTRTTGRV